MLHLPLLLLLLMSYILFKRYINIYIGMFFNTFSNFKLFIPILSFQLPFLNGAGKTPPLISQGAAMLLISLHTLLYKRTTADAVVLAFYVF